MIKILFTGAQAPIAADGLSGLCGSVRINATLNFFDAI
jgi:hypothetical protein